MWVKRDSNLPHWVARERAAKNKTAAANTHCATLKRLRRVTAKYLSVDLCVATRGGLRREGRQRVESSRLAEIAAAPIAAEQIVERGGKSVAVAGLDQEASLLVLDHVAKAARVERDDWSLAKQRFHSHQT